MPKKKGHFSNVCKSKSAKTTNASMFTTLPCAMHKMPDCRTHVSLTALIANTEVSALIDTGSSSSFIYANTAKCLGMKINTLLRKHINVQRLQRLKISRVIVMLMYKLMEVIIMM